MQSSKEYQEKIREAFLSHQCKEIEENNRMGKTRDLFKKVRVTKGIFQAKMITVKDRNGMDLTEQKILRGGKKTQKTIQKRSSQPNNHNCVIAHLEPDILECEVKWALGSITTNETSGGNGPS